MKARPKSFEAVCRGWFSREAQQKEEHKQQKPNRNEVDAATVDLFMFFFGKTDTHAWFLGGTVDQS